LVVFAIKKKQKTFTTNAKRSLKILFACKYQKMFRVLAKKLIAMSHLVTESTHFNQFMYNIFLGIVRLYQGKFIFHKKKKKQQGEHTWPPPHVK